MKHCTSVEGQIRLNPKHHIQYHNFRAGRTFRVHLLQHNSFTDKEKDTCEVTWLALKQLNEEPGLDSWTPDFLVLFSL